MSEEIQIFFTDTEMLTDEQQSCLFEKLPILQKNKALDIKSKKKKKEFIVGRTLLFQALRNNTSYKALPPIIEQPSKAPEIYGLDHCYVSISHSHNLVFCVLHDHPIGIDVEYKKYRENLVEKSRFFMSPQELEKLESIETNDTENENLRLRYFYKIWCAKEAFFKVLDYEAQQCISLESISIFSELKKKWSSLQGEIDDYFWSLVYDGDDCTVRLTPVDLERDLIELKSL